ncbi:MAG: dienelactone hydrolase family protein [Candidatus Bathyarchaeia archaeon]
MKGQMVEFQSNGRTTSGYLTAPETGKGPGVIVIQEWWGLVPHIKDVAERFAQTGYVALAPDLYHGASTTSPDEAGRLMMGMKIDLAERDLAGAISYLLKHNTVVGNGVGTVGFCMGGALSLYAATKNRDVGACVVYYGGHPSVKPKLEDLNAPLLGLYAEKDSFVTVQSVHDLENNLKKLGKQAEIHIYPGVDHAFFNDTRSDVYSRQAAEDSWKRVISFFSKHLG